MIRVSIFAALFPVVFGLAVFNLAHPAQGQVQDAYFEKDYCVDGRGVAIHVVDQQGAFPPFGTGSRGNVTIHSDRSRLSEMSYLAQQFLFTRACLDAAYRNLGTRPAAALECETSKFMARRFKTRPSEIFDIVAELGQRPETVSVARTLSSC